MQAAPRGSPDALTRSSARSPRTPAWNPRGPAECAVHQGTASSRGRGTRCWLCVLHRQGLFGSPSEAFIAKRMTNKLDKTFEMQRSLGPVLLPLGTRQTLMPVRWTRHPWACISSRGRRPGACRPQRHRAKRPLGNARARHPRGKAEAPGGPRIVTSKPIWRINGGRSV